MGGSQRSEFALNDERIVSIFWLGPILLHFAASESREPHPKGKDGERSVS